MNEKISANEFRQSLDRHLSHMKADPWLAQRIIASERGETKVKKKLSVSMIVASLLLVLTTVALAVTGLYRVINWQGDVTRTTDLTQTPGTDTVQAVSEEWHVDSLNSFISEIPNEETAFAWYNNDDGSIKCSELHQKQIPISSIEWFAEYMHDIRHLSVPVSFPGGNVTYCYGKVFMECKAFGKYSLIKNGQSGSMCYNRFLIDESSSIVTGYDLFFALGDPENGTRYIIRSELRDRTYEEPLMLREGETAKKVSIEGMSDALLIMAEDPAYPDGLIMQRKLDEPVQLKQLPLNNRLEESDDRNCQYEYITVWVYNCDDPECLLELFSAE
jgi:hypothetical protein